MPRYMKPKDMFYKGKHTGKTLIEVNDKDPGYLMWMSKNKYIEFSYAEIRDYLFKRQREKAEARRVEDLEAKRKEKIRLQKLQEKYEGVVYFITDNRGRVKIGYTKGDPQDRLSQLQCGNPFPLSVMKEVLGGNGLEKTLHTELKSYRLAGEWFELTPEVIKIIDDL